MLEYSIKYLM